MSFGSSTSSLVENIPLESGVYIVKSIQNFFLLSVEKDILEKNTVFGIKVIPTPNENYIEDNFYKLFESECVQINVIIDNSNNSILEATLDQLEYGKYCNMNSSNMERGYGTIEMCYCALSFASKMFNHSDFDLIDLSEFRCEESSEIINLRRHSILIYGKTWYEKNLGATIVKEEDRLKWEHNIGILHSVIDFNIEDLLNQLSRFINIDNFKEDSMKFVTDNKSWMDYFRFLNEKGCYIFSNNVINTCIEFLELDTYADWKIKIDDSTIDKFVVRYKNIHSVS